MADLKIHGMSIYHSDEREKEFRVFFTFKGLDNEERQKGLAYFAKFNNQVCQTKDGNILKDTLSLTECCNMLKQGSKVTVKFVEDAYNNDLKLVVLTN